MKATRAIKIIKRARIQHTGLVRVDEVPVFDEAERKAQRVSAVNKWISERRENYQLETANLESAMRGWRESFSTS